MRAILDSETQFAIKQMKCAKSPGGDGMTKC